MAAAAKANKDGYIKIGEFAGFDIMAVRTNEGIKGLLRGNQGYTFRFYPEQTTRMISNLQKLVSGLDTYAEEQQGRLADINSEITAQSALMQQPFAKQEEMDKKLSRYNEIMAELNPKEEQAISEDEDGEEETQYSRRKAENEEYDSETASIKQRIENSREKLNSMNVVATVNAPVNFGNSEAVKRWAINMLRHTGFQIDRLGFGKIYFSEKKSKILSSMKEVRQRKRQ